MVVRIRRRTMNPQLPLIPSPVMFDIKTQRIKWEIPEEDIPEGSYELVLGVSSESVDISAVDSISFDIVYGNKTDRSRPSGVIPHSTLKDFFSINIVKDSNGESTDSDPVLDESGNQSTDNSSTWNDNTANPGAFDLHFMELHQDSSKVYRNDSTYKENYPFTWSTDVCNLSPDDISKKIVSYHFSDDGAYAALLTHLTEGQQLELYRIEHGRQDSPLVSTWKLSSSIKTVFDISVSWDGSQVAVLDLTPSAMDEEQRNKYRPLSMILNCHRRQNSTRTSTNATSGSSQEQFTRGELYPRIKDYHGRGTFFASVSQNQGLEDELIVTFDGITLTMYRVFGIWSFYSELAIGVPRSGSKESIANYSHWKEHLRGSCLVLPNDDRGYLHMVFLEKRKPRRCNGYAYCSF
ncbi:hypothetical protein BGX23_008858 [Mortierella sp. AD031]|nr:hypothetical protein BGX23_008858 [Mortierella sp. AD031]